jgi:hypothetical protein
MNVKKIYILATILIVIVAILVVQNKLSSKKPTEQETKFFPSVTEQSIGSILIREGTNSIQLKRTGDVWVVSKPSDDKSGTSATVARSPLLSDTSVSMIPSSATGYPVDSASISSAIEKLTSLKKSALISENPEKQSIFEVDTLKGIIVDMADNSGKSLGTFIVGKSGPDYNSNYVRQKGSNLVYMASGGIRYSFFTDLTRWRNKSIVKFDKSTAQGITLAKNDGSMITIAHADSGNPWEIITPIKNPAKTEEVNGILEKLSQLTATDFQDIPLADTAMGFNKPELGVTVSFKNGSSRNVIFGKKNSDNKYWVKTDGKEQLYLIGEYTVNQINKKLDELKGEPLVKPIAPDSIKKK